MDFATKKLMLLNNKVNEFCTIDFAKEMGLYETDVFKSFLNNLCSLVKKKYLNYNGTLDLKFYTHLWFQNKSYGSVHISCTDFFDGKDVTLFSLKFESGKIILNHLFQKQFDFSFVKDVTPKAYNDFLNDVSILENMFIDEYNKFKNKERRRYEWYHNTLILLEEKNEKFNEKICKYIIENKINDKFVKELSKIVTLNDKNIAFKVAFFKEYNFKNKKLKDNRDFGIIITCTNNDGLHLHITYSIPLDFIEVSKINLISGMSFMKKNTRFKSFIKRELITNLKLDLKSI